MRVGLGTIVTVGVKLARRTGVAEGTVVGFLPAVVAVVVVVADGSSTLEHAARRTAAEVMSWIRINFFIKSLFME
jgi:hypothetical protein